MSAPVTRRRRTRACWLLAGVAVLVAAVLGTGTVGVAHVVSVSMAPSYDVGSTLLTTRVGSADPRRGDVVVFEVPASWRAAADESGADLTSGLMVKRVLAVGGDHVVCCAPGGLVVVNDAVVEEPYLASRPESTSNATYDVTIPAGHLWLVGDNRRRSFDSRAMHVRDPGAGFVPVAAVRALVLRGF
ncbi:signal peptidase I [Nocardioides humi]|uniref:Signal peptidase I n=1 Tax=Nocardioides humi TaxID=449461 RepID=A0ABN2BY48_9ACTN|nr:signal peptidase I [Nocardioides humi]